MSAEIIDGGRYAEELGRGLVEEAERLRSLSINPGLATVAVGSTYSAAAYERRLSRLAEELGVPHRRTSLTDDVDVAVVLTEVDRLNADPAISGILVLRPLPAQIDEVAVLGAIAPTKDVEAVSPENAGRLALGAPRFTPSTAAAAFHLLDSWLDDAGEDRRDFYHGAHITVIGRSNNVGKPCVSLAYAREATVTSVDEWASLTGRLGSFTRRTDVLIVAAGVPGLIRAEHVTSDTVVIDIGINPVSRPDGTVRMVGDVDFDSVVGRARAVTPVPGGVGPLTDLWLLANVLAAAGWHANMNRTHDLAADDRALARGAGR